MDQFNGLALMSSMPLCYGKSHGKKPREGVTPEVFLRTCELFLSTLPATADTQKIGLLTRHLRDEAQDWWHYQCCPAEGVPCPYDRVRIKNDYAYFCEQFKKYFFSITDATGLTQDISDVHPKEGEPLTSFLDRLMYTIRPVTTQFQNRTHRRVDNLDLNVAIPEDLNTQMQQHYHPAAGEVAAPLLEDRLRRNVQQLCANVARLVADQTVYDAEYFNIAQVAARNCKQEWQRTTLNKHMHEDHMDVLRLKHAVADVERTRRTPARYASNLVAAVDGQDAGDTPADEDEDDYDPDAAPDDDDDAPDGDDADQVDAIRGAQRGRGRGKSRGGGKGRGKAPPPGKGRGMWCWFCTTSTHFTRDCNDIRKARELWSTNKPKGKGKGKGKDKAGGQQQQAAPQQQQQQQAPQQQYQQQYQQRPAPYRQQPQHHGGWSQPMDVDASTSSAQFYAAGPSYAHDQPAENY